MACSFPSTRLASFSSFEEVVHVAIVGLNGKGKSHAEELASHERVRIVALCDVDKNLLDAETARLRKAGIPVAAYTDYRKLLENPDIDAVVLAVPHHWHVLMTVWACQAGKDVYVEKPATHNIWEGRQFMAAAKRYGRIIQCGMQRRSDAGWSEALAWINAGNLGKVLFSHGLCYKLRESIGKTVGPQPIPEDIDYDLWCGPREVVPLRRKNLHYDWHNFWEYGNGEVGNQGVHQMDVAAWAISADKLPSGVLSVGGRMGYDDDGQTPNTQYIVLDYKPVPIIFEVMGLPFRKGTEAEPIYMQTRLGNIIHCEGGYLSEGTVYDKDGKRIKHFPIQNGGPHTENWLQAIRNRRESDLNAPPLTGHISAGLCHLANISHRTGQAADPDAIKAATNSSAALSTLDVFQRFRDHLAANGIDIAADKLTLGPHLSFDPETERFPAAADSSISDHANSLLKDAYRKGFEIPDLA